MNIDIEQWGLASLLRQIEAGATLIETLHLRSANEWHLDGTAIADRFPITAHGRNYIGVVHPRPKDLTMWQMTYELTPSGKLFLATQVVPR